MNLNLNFEHDTSWFEPLKDDSVNQTPRYKQVSSPRIVIQTGQLLHDQPVISTSPRHYVKTSVPLTPRQNGQAPLQHSTPRHSAHSSLRSTHHIGFNSSSQPLIRNHSSVRSQKLVGTNQCRPTTYTGIKDECIKTGKLYQDPVFPAADSSLYHYSKLSIRNIKWKRPSEIVKKPKFIASDVSEMDIEPGKLGDSCLVSAFTCLLMTPKLLVRCVPTDQSFLENYAGIFHFRFWRYGEWIDVIVDDRLPTVDGHLLYMRSSDPEEFWPALLEKAYAKLYGSYENIHGGRIRWALQDITGGITNSHSVIDNSRHLLTVIDLAMSRASLIGAYISTAATGNIPGVMFNGLTTGHTYSITGYAEIPVTGGQIILLRLRNPWLNIMWSGAWSLRSPHWKVLNESTKERMGIDNMMDGEIWISFVDFKNIFTEIEICHLGPECWKIEPGIQHRGIWTASVAHRQWKKGFNAGGCVIPSIMCNNSQFYIELDRRMAVIVSLMQKYKTTTQKFQSCSCLVYKVQKGLDHRVDADFFIHNNVYAKTKFVQSRENVHTLVLSEGSYLIIPVTEVEGQESRYMLRFFTAGNSIIKELDDEDKTVEIQGYCFVDICPIEVKEIPWGCYPDGVEHSVHPDKVNQLRRQFKNTIRHTKHEEVDASGLQSILATKPKDKIPFLCCSPEYKIINFKPLNLNVETCKAAITIFDNNVDGRLNYSDFNKLLSKLISWQNVFRKFAKGNPDFNSYSLRSALRFTGFHVSNKTLEILVIRLTNHGRVTLDQFICIMIKLIIAHGRFKKSSVSSVNSQESLLGELLRTAIYS